MIIEDDSGWGSADQLLFAITAPLTNRNSLMTNEDKSRDYSRPSDEIHCEMIKLADMYGMSSLLHFASRAMVQHQAWLQADAEKFWKFHDRIGRDVIARHDYLINHFASYAARIFADLDEEDVQAWIRDDAVFGYRLALNLQNISRRACRHCGNCPQEDSPGW